MPQITTKVAAWFKFPDSKALMKAPNPGQPLVFRPEPENPYDKNAVALFITDTVITNTSTPADLERTANKIQCGYLPRAVAETIKSCDIISVVRGDSFDEIIVTYGE